MEEDEKDAKGVGPAPDGGKGTGPSSDVTPPKRKRKRTGGRRRGDDELDRRLEPDLAVLVRQVGRNKLAPDTSAVERHYSRSLRFRTLIVEFLRENNGTTWADVGELDARAANYAGCASQTAARWVYQLTRVGAPFRLVDALDHWILERRD